jgi:aminoglycoside phosphotransferase
VPVVRREPHARYSPSYQAEKNIWAELGFGDFYHELAMAVLDICARTRHQNGGIMRIDDILAAYRRKQTNAITKYVALVADRT